MAVAELLQSLPNLLPGSRVLVIYDSRALDRFSPNERSGPEGGVTLRSTFSDCILYETQLLPERRSQELPQNSSAR
jgi:hypothetical protein